MYKIYVRFTTGKRECVDETDSKKDAEYLTGEYSLAFQESITDIWVEEDDE